MKPLLKAKLILAVLAVVFLTSVILLVPVVKNCIWPQYPGPYADTTNIVIKNCMPGYITYNSRTYIANSFVGDESIGNQIGVLNKNDKNNATFANEPVYQIKGFDSNRIIAYLVRTNPLIYLSFYNADYWKDALPEIIILSALILFSAICFFVCKFHYKITFAGMIKFKKERIVKNEKT